MLLQFVQCVVVDRVATVDIPPSLTGVSNSKLTLHVGDVAGVDAAVAAFLAAAQPRTLKLLDPKPGWAAAALRASPETQLIGRVWTPTQPTDGDPRAAAAAWLNATRPFFSASPEIQLWEGYNELPGTASNRSLMQWYSEFEQARVQLLAGVGLRAVVGAFATSDLEDLDPRRSRYSRPQRARLPRPAASSPCTNTRRR